MNAKIDPNETTVQMGVRVTATLAAALDAEARRMEQEHPGFRYTRSEVARAILHRVLLTSVPIGGVERLPQPSSTRTLPQPTESPSPGSAAIQPATERKRSDPHTRAFSEEAQRANEAEAQRLEADATQRQREKTLALVKAAKARRAEVMAALRAVEVPGADILDVAAVVRNLEAQGHEREAIHAELVRLGTAGVDVLELRPDSGGGNERIEDRAIVPHGLDGTPLLTARWKNRPETEHDSDGLRVRFREALRRKQTSINKSAEPAGCSITPLRRWLNEGKALDPAFRENLAKHLDSLG